MLREGRKVKGRQLTTIDVGKRQEMLVMDSTSAISMVIGGL